MENKTFTFDFHCKSLDSCCHTLYYPDGTKLDECCSSPNTLYYAPFLKVKTFLLKKK